MLNTSPGHHWRTIRPARIYIDDGVFSITDLYRVSITVTTQDVRNAGKLPTL